MENHAKESIKHKVVLPNSKTINIEGTKFKYEIHYDQLNDKDLLTIEKYANYIFYAYHERYGLDINTDRTFKGFIYNSLTDLRNARPGHNTAYATASFHHYPYKSGSIAHDLTAMIYITLNFYNKQSRDIPIPKGNFRIDVPKELKAIKLDDNQKESNTAEKPETTINQKEQEESKKVEPSGSGEEEKIKVDEKKSSQEKISPETVLPNLNNSDNNQKESNTAEKPETTINRKEQEESKKVEPSGSEEDEKIKLDEEKSSQKEISTETVLPDLNNSDNNQKESNTDEKSKTTINQEEPKRTEPSGSVEEAKSSQEEISPETVLPDLNNSDNNQKESNTAEKPETTINQEKQEESKKIELSGSGEEEKSKVEEAKSSQEETSTEKHKVVLPNSKTINIEGTNFKYEIHYDQLNDKDLLTIERYANHIFHAYQKRYGLDMNTDHTVKGFIYNNLTDLRNARPGHNTGYAGASFHHYPHNSGSIAHDLTELIYYTLNLYNKGKHGIPSPKGNFRIDVPKELKAIKLDDQEESNTAEKPETTINQKEQEESKKVELSGSGEGEKIKVEEKKSGQEEISPETVLPDLNNSNDNQEESNTAEKPETTINQEKQEESKKVESSGPEEEEKIKLEEEKSSQEEISLETMLPDLNNSNNNQEESNTAEKPETTINQEKQEESKKVESSGPEEEEKIKLEEEKSSQEEISPETMLPHSKIVNIEGTNFKLKVHYDQLDDQDLLRTCLKSRRKEVK